MSNINGFCNPRHHSHSYLCRTLSSSLTHCSLMSPDQSIYKAVLNCHLMRGINLPVMLSLKFDSLHVSSHLFIFEMVDSQLLVQENGSLQRAHTWHELAGGDAHQWWAIPTNDRITLDVASPRQSFSEYRDEVAHHRSSILKSSTPL